MALGYALGVCSLGSVLVADAGEGLCAILLGDEPEALLADLRERFAIDGEPIVDSACKASLAQVVALIEEPARGCALRLAPRGTAFQLRVWAALREIPPGTTTTYTALAASLGLAPAAVRAVAGACAANPLAVAVPCHRVVRQGGALAGYRWGLERKRLLLEREAGGSEQLGLWAEARL